MEITAYRQAAAGHKVHQSSSKENRKENRRVIQLIASLLIFTVVFLGRAAFPKLCSNLQRIMGEDIAFSQIISEVGQSAAEVFHVSEMMPGLIKEELEDVIPNLDTNLEDTADQPTPDIVTPLSEMEKIGLDYYKTHGLRKHPEEAEKNVPNEPKAGTTEPEIVTAVAQPYNEKGETLPRNVSYQYYELGLEKTVVPVMGEITSGFDYRISPITGQREFHLALDIAAAKGTEIAAFADGVVRYIGESDDFGLYFMIDHANGVATFYAHCSKLLVRKGEPVTCGQIVALVGDTGNATGHHLHFTIEKDNIRLDPAYYVSP